MEYLYVCAFSNGTVKVGRSKNADARVRQHEERVAVLGISMREWKKFPCEYGISGAETWLIRACETAAEVQRGNEWFEGLPFAQACAFAEQACKEPTARISESCEGPRPDFPAVIRALNAGGYRQTDLARICGVAQSSISDIANGHTAEPSYSIGFTLMALLHSERGMSMARAVNNELARA